MPDELFPDHVVITAEQAAKLNERVAQADARIERDVEFAREVIADDTKPAPQPEPEPEPEPEAQP